MKNLFFVFVLAIGLMSFTSSDEVKNDLTSTSLNQVENVEVETFDYWLRYCVYINGTKFCTEWQYVIE
jgi:hypothetical protein